MIVVSDTSPLTNLAAIGRFDVLRALFGEVRIPEGVWNELHYDSKSWPGAKEAASAGWIHRHAVQNEALVRALLGELDRGEAEAIALAVEHRADLLLLDEAEGRRVARRMGLEVAGLVGVLVMARKRNLIPVLAPELQALRERAGFFLSEAVVRRALAEVGEAG